MCFNGGEKGRWGRGVVDPLKSAVLPFHSTAAALSDMFAGWFVTWFRLAGADLLCEENIVD